MPVTDTDMIKDVTYRLLENGDADATGTSLLTDMFSITEIVDSMNRVQQKFMIDTGMILTRLGTPIPVTMGNGRYDLPTDNSAVVRVSYTDFQATAEVTRALTPTDTWELDTAINLWPSGADTPITWWQTTLAQQRLGIAPIPNNVGELNLLYVALAATLTGAGVNLTVPDDWAPYVLWGTLQELLSSDGPAFEPLRAQYAGRRYQEGVELARVVLGGH